MNDVLRFFFLITILFGAVFHFSPSFQDKTTDLVASTFFIDSVNADDIADKYEKAQNQRKKDQNPPVKILIVPGHDNKNSGAIHNGVKEADLNLKVARYLFNLLDQEKGIEVTLARNENGYDPELKRFFETETDEIVQFYQEKKQIMKNLIAEGRVQTYVNVVHNFAKPEVANVLYGINKFANDNQYDIILHIHFNDYPGRGGKIGKHNGFSIYIPEKQYSNAKASRIFAEKVFNQLAFLFPESSLEKESGITEDQELIAVGSNNTIDPISVLVEYGYIYESQFHNPKFREYVFDEIANKTYVGVMDFLNSEESEPTNFSKLDNYFWQNNIAYGDDGLDVLALQNFLKRIGIYPVGKNLNNCPLNGYFGQCTKEALLIFQERYSLDKTGVFDTATREKVNLLKTKRF